MAELLLFAAAAYMASLVTWLSSLGGDGAEDVYIVGIFLKAREGPRLGGYVVAVTTMAALSVLARRLGGRRPTEPLAAEDARRPGAAGR